MACNKFEESGLLYVSEELDEHEIRQYEAHLEVCSECRYETESYKKERASFYSTQILSENPSESVDKEIIRVCGASSKKKYTTAYLPIFLKKHAAAPVYLLMIMLAIGGYVQYHSMNAESMRAKLMNETTLPVTSTALAPEHDISAVAFSETDSSGFLDSISDSGAAFSKTRGNLNMEGVVTVKSGE
ncbi:MAG: zf-HC2 domain-containing protein [Chitinispirillales bacterium]|jgi:hypothetical protein|nr:zf-HC2 domain-containing protein [Chitinispirillales bacterium]